MAVIYTAIVGGLCTAKIKENKWQRLTGYRVSGKKKCDREIIINNINSDDILWNMHANTM